jgi:hypothetical protein
MAAIVDDVLTAGPWFVVDLALEERLAAKPKRRGPS